MTYVLLEGSLCEVMRTMYQKHCGPRAKSSCPAFPDGYRLQSSPSGGSVVLLRRNGSEVGSFFEPGEVSLAEKSAFEDAKERSDKRRRQNPIYEGLATPRKTV